MPAIVWPVLHCYPCLYSLSDFGPTHLTSQGLEPKEQSQGGAWIEKPRRSHAFFFPPPPHPPHTHPSPPYAHSERYRTPHTSPTLTPLLFATTTRASGSKSRRDRVCRTTAGFIRARDRPCQIKWRVVWCVVCGWGSVVSCWGVWRSVLAECASIACGFGE